MEMVLSTVVLQQFPHMKGESGHQILMTISTVASGLDGSGSLALACQWGSLLVTLILSSILDSPACVHVLAAGLVASRFGLWAFDLAVLQMLQEMVPNEQLGMPLTSCSLPGLSVEARLSWSCSKLCRAVSAIALAEAGAAKHAP